MQRIFAAACLLLASCACAAEAAGAGTITLRVRSGQSLSGIFESNRVRAADLVRLMAAGAPARRLARLRPGEQIELRRGPGGALESLTLRSGVERAWHFERRGGVFEAREEVAELDVHEATAHAVITSSLYEAARDAGLSNRLVLALAGVFEWDVDLARDLRRGDRFSVVYEELHLDGRKVRDGKVLAAELVSRGRRYRAVRYRDPEGRVGYYTPEGVSVQAAFLRSPVEFSRVSSRFSAGRRHPVLQRVRAHRGVDYAAPTGTPVRATGDGRVVFAGRKGGYGNTVVIEHGGRIATLYAHLSRIATGIRPGTRAVQGQTIGQVGQSGLATGPHLHYEYRENGVHRDALRVELPEGVPVPERFLAHFRAATGSLASQLTHLGRTQLASR